MEKVYMVYDTKDSDICVGQFDNAQEVADYFNRTKNSVHSSICQKVKFKGRYRVEIVDIGGQANDNRS
jgi:hypothetical protein